MVKVVLCGLCNVFHSFWKFNIWLGFHLFGPKCNDSNADRPDMSMLCCIPGQKDHRDEGERDPPPLREGLSILKKTIFPPLKKIKAVSDFIHQAGRAVGTCMNIRILGRNSVATVPAVQGNSPFHGLNLSSVYL